MFDVMERMGFLVLRWKLRALWMRWGLVKPWRSARLGSHPDRRSDLSEERQTTFNDMVRVALGTIFWECRS